MNGLSWGFSHPMFDNVLDIVDFAMPTLQPTSDFKKADDGTLLGRFTVTGVEPDQVIVTADETTLSIEYPAMSGRRITRRWSIDRTYDVARTTASLRLGILELRIPRHEKDKERTIRVTVAG